MPYSNIPDYHMHTPRCNHAVGTVREYADAAIAAGLKEIGMSDHSPMPGDFDAAWRMHISELEDYIAEVRQTRIDVADALQLKLGLEADYHPGTEKFVREMIGAHDWDYIIGSVHFIGDWGFDNPDMMDRWDTCDVDQAYCDYFDLVADSARSGMFDIIGHPDLIKKFGHRPTAGSQRVRQSIMQMLEAVKAADIVLEISSAGLRKPVTEIYPHSELIREASKLGIPFSFGSDAHSPVEVGHGIGECIALLKACGIKEIASFTRRKRSMIPIDHG